ncbi:hypothetical protein BU16DRAFT_613350 [Lophium mytilinum]|uniref:Transcription factor domain-containing protein n=1 Tax=Lophium mytilinum TaxID=390894 RepID=A0A6A6R9G7_9PEZI|nr:hypothetical protein BU16DRAFT_613350 [Lophium mytilinum]
METQQPRKRRRAKGSEEQDGQQENFLFVDSSDQQGTSKPDRASRSFVMQQARKQKTWSTKKFPANSAAKRSSKAPPRDDSPSEKGSLSWVHYAPKDESLHKGEKIVPYRGGGSPLEQPAVCRLPFCNGDFCSQSHHSPPCSDELKLSPRSRGRLEIAAIGVLDPFNALPVRADPRSYALIDHYSRNVVPLMIPVDLRRRSRAGRDEFLASAIRDDARGAFTHTVLCSAALHRFAMGVGPLDDVLYHKAESVSKINANLSDPGFRVHDNNIAAVFNLLNIEESLLGIVSAGGGWPGLAFDPQQKLMHLNGLRAMLQQRGGLAGLSSSRCLQAFILWHSIAHSIASFEQPYASLIDTNGRAYTYTIPASPKSPPRSSPVQVLRLFRDLNLDIDLQDIAADVSLLSSDMTSWLDDPNCPLDPIELQKHGFLLLQRCLAFLDESTAPKSPLEQCVCLALIIFVIRITQPADYSFKTMVAASLPRLREALKKTSIFSWSDSPDILLWVLTLGTLAAQGSQHMGFFTRYSTVAFADAGVDSNTSCEDLLARMKRCLWHSSLMDNAVKKLWVKFGLAKSGDEGPVEDDELDTDTVSHVSSPDGIDEAAVGRLTSTRFFT